MNRNTFLLVALFLLAITLNSQAQEVPQPKSISVTLDNPSRNSQDPLFILSINEQTAEVPKIEFFNNPTGIQPEWINSIHVLKNKEATDKYGTRGQNGVVLITLKKEAFDKLSDDLKAKFETKN